MECLDYLHYLRKEKDLVSIGINDLSLVFGYSKSP